MNKTPLWAVLSLALTGAAVQPAFAQTAAVPVPQVTLLPVTVDSYPLGAADRLNVPEDLSQVGYVEEEYLVSGLANVYEWSPPAPATVRTPDAPYTTRMLVRRPKNRTALSGNVIVEILNASNLVDLEIGWALSKDYIVRHGDVWIGFTSKPVTAQALQKFNARRYARLSFANPLPLSDPNNCTVLSSVVGGDSSRSTENGLLWDIFSQIAAWARTKNNLTPISAAQKVYGYGYSQSGFDLQTYIDAVFPLAKQGNGQPIFDGFLDVTGFNSPAPINQCIPAPSGAGPAQIRNAGVPVLRMASNSEILLASVRAGRRQDSDVLQDRFREYEVAGAAHASQNELDFGPNYLDILAAGAPLPPLTAGFGPRSPLNLGIFQNAAFYNLDAWVRTNVAPPAGALVNFDGNGNAVLDQYGNYTGGVRPSYLDVPTARYFVGSPGPGLSFLLGYINQFNALQIRALYPNHSAYVQAVTAQVQNAVSQRYLLPDDGDKIIQAAKKADTPPLPDLPSDLPDGLTNPATVSRAATSAASAD